jgi:hypothetical protein
MAAVEADKIEEPLFNMPGRDSCRFPWRAPGNVDRALPGPAARRLYPAGPLHEACRRGNLGALEAHLAAGGSADELDGVRACVVHALARRACPFTSADP